MRKINKTWTYLDTSSANWNEDFDKKEAMLRTENKRVRSNQKLQIVAQERNARQEDRRMKLFDLIPFSVAMSLGEFIVAYKA